MIRGDVMRVRADAASGGGLGWIPREIAQGRGRRSGGISFSYISRERLGGGYSVRPPRARSRARQCGKANLVFR
eukprot:scaffold5366_cov350-Prasinococcus_capsulatus_cf.AAC.2